MVDEPNSEHLRDAVKAQLPNLVHRLNEALSGDGLAELEPILARLGRGGQLPHWFSQLSEHGTLPNLDGKTIGSVLEMLLVAIMQATLFENGPQLTINPARGVDLPELELGIKSPSKNYSTSEPFFSPYERLVGGEYDVIVFLTDYQEKKGTPPLKLSVISHKYVSKSQIADENLCRIARKHRTWLLESNELWALKLFKFLAFVNQSDWQAKRILDLVEQIDDDRAVLETINGLRAKVERENVKRIRDGSFPIGDDLLMSIENIRDINPVMLGVVDIADNWVLSTHGEFGRAPNESEWHKLISGPLNGTIGISYALQWRFNFAKIFGHKGEDAQEGGEDPELAVEI